MPMSFLSGRTPIHRKSGWLPARNRRQSGASSARPAAVGAAQEPRRQPGCDLGLSGSGNARQQQAVRHPALRLQRAQARAHRLEPGHVRPFEQRRRRRREGDIVLRFLHPPSLSARGAASTPSIIVATPAAISGLRPCRIDDAHAIRLALGDRLVRATHAFEERRVLRFDAVPPGAATGEARMRDLRRRVEDQREVRRRVRDARSPRARGSRPRPRPGRRPGTPRSCP